MDLDKYEVSYETLAQSAMRILCKFASREQLHLILNDLSSPDCKKTLKKVITAANNIISMPNDYQQFPQIDTIVYLHYYRDYRDWFITEHGLYGDGIKQDFGFFIILNDYENYEYTAISINHLRHINAYLNLDFEPCLLREVINKANFYRSFSSKRPTEYDINNIQWTNTEQEIASRMRGSDSNHASNIYRTDSNSLLIH